MSSIRAEDITNLSLLPAATQAAFEVVDAERFSERWDQTVLGKITGDPSLKPFWDAQQETIRKRLANSGLAANITFQDLQNIASGSMVLAWVQLQSKTGVCLIVEVDDREEQTAAVLKRIDKDLKEKRGAIVTTMQYRGQDVSVYSLKKKIGQINVEQFSYVRTDNRLIASDQQDLIRSILDAIQDESKRGGLVESPEFMTIDGRVRDNSDADIVWFVRPLEYAKILETRGGGLKKQQLDTIELLRDQGFDAIRCAGGRLTLALEDFDLRHRAYILAPPTTELESRYRLAARMLQFPNMDAQQPPDWVMPSVASYLDGNWKMEEAFWAAETLVNQAVGDEIFRRVVDGIRKDKDGPQIDLANDIIANMQNRLIMLTDNVMPVTKQSERMLIAVSLKNVDRVKAAVDKAMRSDPNAIAYDYEHHDWIWQVTQPEIEDDLDLEGFEDFGEFDDFGDEEADSEQPPLLDQWAITVYDGYLMFSSHAQMLVDTIEHHRNLKPGQKIQEQTDFQNARDALQKQQGSSRAIWRILRSDLAFRIKWELFRRGELKDSDSVLASIIRRILEGVESEDSEDLKIDGSTLPAFEKIKQHLQPSGIMFKTTDDGWMMNGIMLKAP